MIIAKILNLTEKKLQLIFHVIFLHLIFHVFNAPQTLKGNRNIQGLALIRAVFRIAFACMLYDVSLCCQVHYLFDSRRLVFWQ